MKSVVRVVLASAGTVVAVGGLVGTKALTGHGTVAVAPEPGVGTPAPTTGTSAPGTSAPGAGATFTGDSVSTRYGDVQVEITVESGTISDIRVLAAPDGDSRSRSVSARAVPTLVSRALAAQSAHIDAVSGATFTSRGYETSLQSAIDKAGL